MTTIVDFLTVAHRLIGVVGESQSLSAEQGATSLMRLNQLMESLAVDSIDVGYTPQSKTTDDLPMPLWAERGIGAKLAKDLLSIYPSAQPPSDVMNDDLNGFNALKRLLIVQKLDPVSTLHLGAGAGWGGQWSVTTDLVVPR